MQAAGYCFDMPIMPIKSDRERQHCDVNADESLMICSLEKNGANANLFKKFLMKP